MRTAVRTARLSRARVVYARVRSHARVGSHTRVGSRLGSRALLERLTRERRVVHERARGGEPAAVPRVLGVERRAMPAKGRLVVLRAINDERIRARPGPPRALYAVAQVRRLARLVAGDGACVRVTAISVSTTVSTSRLARGPVAATASALSRASAASSAPSTPRVAFSQSSRAFFSLRASLRDAKADAS